jgi:hypothetical protein
MGISWILIRKGWRFGRREPRDGEVEVEVDV